MGLNPKLLMFAYFAFICGHIICLMLEGDWLAGNDENVINSLLGFDLTELSSSGLMAIPKASIGFFTHGVPKLILWDYSFFYGSFAIFRFTLCFAISIGVVWGVVTLSVNFAFGLASRVLGW